MVKQRLQLLLPVLLLATATRISAHMQYRTHPRSSAVHERSLQSDAEIRTELASGEAIGGLADFYPANSTGPIGYVRLYSPNKQVKLVMENTGSLTLQNFTGVTSESVWKGRDVSDLILEDQKINGSTLEMHVSQAHNCKLQYYMIST
jgi:hypothetical protein